MPDDRDQSLCPFWPQLWTFFSIRFASVRATLLELNLRTKKKKKRCTWCTVRIQNVVDVTTLTVLKHISRSRYKLSCRWSFAAGANCSLLKASNSWPLKSCLTTETFSIQNPVLCVDTAAGLNILGGSGKKSELFMAYCVDASQKERQSREKSIFLFGIVNGFDAQFFFFEPLLARGRR